MKSYSKVTVAMLAAVSLNACVLDDDEVDVVNTAPQAVGDMLTTTTDTPLEGMLSATDAQQDPLTFSVAVAPTAGEVMLNADGDFVYIPAAEFVGSDSFEFSVSDGRLTDTAVVIIDIETLTVSVSAIVRDSFTQAPTAEPLAVNGREFNADVTDTAEFDDLVAAGEVGNNE